MTTHKSNSEGVAQPHDRLVKRLLSNPKTAKEILSLYLPKEILALADLNHLSLQRDSFIDDEHRAFAVDLLFKTTFQKEEGYFWVLLEHQRNNDPWLPVRIFKYIAIIWDHLRKTSKTQKIPLVYPIIIYNGSRPYSHSLTLKDMITPAASQKIFEDFFKTPFCLIDLTIIEDETLRKNLQNHVKGIALLMTLKHIFDKNLQTYFEHTLVTAFKQLDQSNSRDELVDMLYYLLNEGIFLNKERFWHILHKEFNPATEGKVMTIAQELKAQGIEEGILKGRLEGRLEGKLEGKLEAKLEVAQRMLANGIDLNVIATLAELPIKHIKQLYKHKTNTFSSLILKKSQEN